jgi:CRP-like cAMP-binding protein
MISPKQPPKTNELSREVFVENLILAAISPDEYQRLLRDLEPVSLPLGASLYKSGDVIEHVFFPRTALVSLVTHMKDGVAVEVGVIGKDGMVGIPVLLGDDIAFEEAIVQVAGSAMRMRSAVLKQALQRSHSLLLTQLLLYTRALMKQVVQTAACNRLHNEKQRLARWLLMCRDRLESDELALTQDFLSDILGLRRASVTNTASNLQTAGLIRYTPGSIKILNRQRLEESACQCYQVVAGGGKLASTTGPRQKAGDLKKVRAATSSPRYRSLT